MRWIHAAAVSTAVFSLIPCGFAQQRPQQPPNHRTQDLRDLNQLFSPPILPAELAVHAVEVNQVRSLLSSGLGSAAYDRAEQLVRKGRAEALKSGTVGRPAINPLNPFPSNAPNAPQPFPPGPQQAAPQPIQPGPRDHVSVGLPLRPDFDRRAQNWLASVKAYSDQPKYTSEQRNILTSLAPLQQLAIRLRDTGKLRLGLTASQMLPNLERKLGRSKQADQISQWTKQFSLSLPEDQRQETAQAYVDLVEYLLRTDEGRKQLWLCTLIALQAAETQKRQDGKSSSNYAQLQKWASELKELSIANSRGNSSWRALKYEEAAQRALEVCRLERKLSVDPLHLSRVLAWAARLQHMNGDFPRGRELIAEAVNLVTALHGEKHYLAVLHRVQLEESKRASKLGPEVARRTERVHLRYADLHRQAAMGRYRGVTPIVQGDLQYFEQTVGHQHSAYLLALNVLGRAQVAAGNTAEALPTRRRAVDLAEALYGQESASYVYAISELASLYRDIGDAASALPLQQQTLELRGQVWGKNSESYVTGLNNLAVVYLQLHQEDLAAPLLEDALAYYQQHEGPASKSTTGLMANLAACYLSIEELSKAEKLLLRVIEIESKTLAQDHPIFLTNVRLLIDTYNRTGQHEEAFKLGQRWLMYAERVYHSKHASLASGLGSLGSTCNGAGNYVDAERHFRKALDIQREILDKTFGVLSEEQQLLMTHQTRDLLHGYIWSTQQLRSPGGWAYRHVLAWKGAVFDQQRRRNWNTHDPAIASMVARYQQTARTLAKFAHGEPPNEQERDAWRVNIENLSRAKERLQAELFNKSESFRKSHEPISQEKVQTLLPEDAALVDFWIYSNVQWPEKGKRVEGARLAAFIVRDKGDVIQLDLGYVHPIQQAANAWRNSIQRGGGASRGLKMLKPKDNVSQQPPQYELKRLLWEPLEKYLGDATTVLIAPDEFLAQVPFAALPGNEDERYLLDERSIVVVPNARLLPDIVQDNSASNQDQSMVLVGGVDFGANPPIADDAVSGRQGGSDRAAKLHFDPLPGTGREMLAIGRLYRERHPKAAMTGLYRDLATEEKFRESASNSRYLHLATHGFFLPQKSQTQHRHPGLLSGLALAGANRRANNSASYDDGLLTALEVATLNLRGVDLAVLSACETGLGTIASGEGLLGLQRAFQIAGADSVVTSLWKVDDAATEALMIEFYRLLWEKKLGKLEALRQAQLAMLDDYDPESQKLKLRGLRFANRPEKREAPTTRLPPYFWAAFVLSGDWQ